MLPKGVRTEVLIGTAISFWLKAAAINEASESTDEGSTESVFVSQSQKVPAKARYLI